jgi:HlyD family secretion protein
LWIPLTLIAAGIGCVLGGLGVSYYPRDKFTSDSAGADERSLALDKVVALGRIEPKGGVLALGVPAPDRISRILVHEGAPVKKGDPLVILDSEVLRESERQLAVTQREQAETRLHAIEASGNAEIRVEKVRRERIDEVEPLEIKALKSKIDFLRDQKQNAALDFRRYKDAGDTVAQQDKDKQRLVVNQTETELIAAECQLEKLRRTGDLNRSLAEAQLQAARAKLAESKSAISLKLLDQQAKQARERLRESQIHAPCDGKILRILVHEGELVRAQPILQMANVDEMIALTEVYETDIHRVQLGQIATITSELFKGEDALKGTVVWKAGSVGKARVIALDPRAAVDNRIVDVKIALDRPRRVADLIGHQVRVEIQTGR